MLAHALSAVVERRACVGGKYLSHLATGSARLSHPTFVVLAGRSLLTNLHFLANKLSIVLVCNDLPVRLAETSALLADLVFDEMFDVTLLSLIPVRTGLLCGTGTWAVVLVEGAVKYLLAPLGGR